MKSYFLRHLQVFFYSLGQMARTPFATLTTIAVIGISLALPGGLYLMLENLQRISSAWDGAAQFSVFLKHGVAESSAKALANQISGRAEIADVRYISPQAALAEFKRLSGFGDALNALDRNPLPAVLVVKPKPEHADSETLVAFIGGLNTLREVELVQVDLEWIKRLNAIVELAKRGVWLMAAILALAVILVIGNTIRLAVLNRRTEIEIIKLIGGTNAFIRRPFLYTGLQQGLLGAFCAWGLLALVLALLDGPVRELASLYASQYELRGLGVDASLYLFVSGAVLGWLGSRLAVGRHLRAIEPA